MAERFVDDRCGQCTNCCRIRFSVDSDDVVLWARRKLPRHNGIKLVSCPNLEKAENCPMKEALDAVHTRIASKVVLSGH